ncbi:hypothetical protein [Acetobacter pasteurianus]|uniref:hypothetical protein n=1 Tax=Acetobacter pasteurianus TaxID=438 RepID=UPI00202DD414|nr:hypothetical protein [Acetobacter pasteurianus]
MNPSYLSGRSVSTKPGAIQPASRRLEGVFEKAIGEVRKERQALASIVGEANNRRDQWFYLIFIGLMAFLFGVGVAPLLFNHITWKNFDERVASFIVGGRIGGSPELR